MLGRLFKTGARFNRTERSCIAWQGSAAPTQAGKEIKIPEIMVVMERMEWFHQNSGGTTLSIPKLLQDTRTQAHPRYSIKISTEIDFKSLPEDVQADSLRDLFNSDLREIGTEL